MSYVAQLLATFRAHPYLLDRHPELLPLKMQAELGRMSEAMAKIVLFQVQELIERYRDFPCYLSRPPTGSQLMANGPADIEFLTLAESDEDLRYGISLCDHPRFLIAIGAAGSGKTNALRAIVTKVHEHNQQNPDTYISTIVIDQKGGDYADLPSLLGPDWLHLSVHDGMRVGLNAPTGVPPGIWRSFLATVIGARAGLISSTITFSALVDILLPALNQSPGNALLWPDWRALDEGMSIIPWRAVADKEPYFQTLRQAVRGMRQAPPGLTHAFSGIDLQRHVVDQRRSVVISTPNLYPHWYRSLLVDVLIGQLIIPRIHQHHRVDTTEVLLVIDEADALVDRQVEANFPGGFSPLALLERQGREFGVACCLGMSALGNASRHVLNSAHYHLVFALSDAESVLEAKRTLMLPPHAELQIPALKPGTAIFRESQGSWPHAMLVDVDYVAPNRMPPPQEYDSHPFIPSKPLDELPDVLEALKRVKSGHWNANLAKGGRSAPELSENARKLLQLWDVHPYTPCAQLWKQLDSPSFPVQKATYKELNDAGLAEFEQIRVGRRNMLFMETTPEGREWLERKQ